MLAAMQALTDQLMKPGNAASPQLCSTAAHQCRGDYSKEAAALARHDCGGCVGATRKLTSRRPTKTRAGKVPTEAAGGFRALFPLILQPASLRRKCALRTGF